MSDTDLIKLYSGRILALAAEMPLTNRLSQPGATVRKRSPLCGSTVTVDVDMTDGVVTAFGQDVKACALGQAAASVVASHVIGRTAQDLRAARDALSDMLKHNGPIPPAPFDALEVLIPARDFKNRHASIMLSLDALVEATSDLEAQRSA